MPIHRLALATILLALAAGCASMSSADTDDGASSSAWRDSFPVDKANLGPTGDNPFFPLHAGAVATYTDGDVTLTITALDETRVVDGVTTRVIEEREEEDGHLVEISRNFFAADRATGDVYYFGEEVDIYKDGKVANHEGAWLSGVDGAHFGLFMPGKAAVGDRFYQEVAPRVAMDRCEIVSLGERVETPGGVFERCVLVTETTPLERGVGRKWYAAGVGLIKDDDLALTSRHTRSK